MKKLLYLIIGAPLVIYAQNQKSRPDDTVEQGIQFEQHLNWEQVKAKARAENKYIFVDVYASWCVPCKQMDKEVYPNDTVGNYMTGKFISVKVQMDSTGRDNEEVKRWYADARAIEKEYKIGGFPSFLFLNPAGILAYKDIGYKNVPDFLKMVNKARDPQNILYYSKVEDYKEGKKNYQEMYDLVGFVRSTLADDTLAKQMAEDYINHVDKKRLLSKEKILFVRDIARNRKLADSLVKEYNDNYLNVLSEEEFCKRENLRFIEQFNHLITSKDKIFQLSYSNAEKIDSAIGFKGAGNYYVHSTIMREEIKSRLFQDDKPVFKNPDWNKISVIIQEKYSKVDVKELMLNYQIGHYRRLNDWLQWAKCKDQKIKKGDKITPYVPQSASMEILIELNELGAWDAFLNCNDERVLIQALGWIELAIRLTESDPFIAFLDTRANLLYKLGRVKEAIAQEEKAVEIALARSQQEEVNLQSLMRAINDFRKVLEKMRKGEPTYVEEGAVWNTKALQKIHSGKKPAN